MTFHISPLTLNLTHKSQSSRKITVTMTYKISSICIKVISFAFFLLLFQSAKAQQDFSNVEAVLQQHQKTLGKDYVLMIWKKDDTLVYKKEFGDFTMKTQAPIASCSKWLTAALVMTFVDEGKLSLDDKITKWLPEYEKYSKGYITIRHCLSHFTGIEADPITLRSLLGRKKYSSLEEEVNSFASRDIYANPGEKFFYSNVGLNIAARICEIISKRKFDVLIRQRLFVPLGMRKTTFSTLDGSAPNPSGGALSTPEDYMHFLVMMLNKGMYQGKQILSEASVNEMMKVQTNSSNIKYAPKAAEGFNYTLGAWAVEESPLSSSPQGERVATAVACPGLFGTFPMVDYCRGYAYLFFVKNLLNEDKKDAQLDIKSAVDEHFHSSCK